MKKTYKIIVSYDGTNYFGWQIQPQVKTVTQTLQDAFAKAFGKTIKLLGASRTDAGVHATAQVARFYSDLNIRPEKLLFAWNNILPNDIVIKDLQKTREDFHPIIEAKQKTYHYHIFTKRPSPFVARYGWHYFKKIDLEKLETCLDIFVGTHDFASFCTDVPKEKNTVRTIDSITIEKNNDWDAHKIIFKGPGFLTHMIRRIVGACLHVASCDIPVSYLQQMLDEKNPNQHLPSAPARGLLLYKIKYPSIHPTSPNGYDGHSGRTETTEK